MSFDRDMLSPNQSTHVPVMVVVPAETENWTGDGRPYLPPPTLWKVGAEVVNKRTGRRAAIRVVDHMTMQFRAYYPDTGENDGRTMWQHCHEWNVSVTLSPEEETRLAAKRQLDEEVAKLDIDELAAVEVLVDDPNPTKALAKLEALKRMGIIKGAPAAHAASLDKKGGK